VARRWRSVDRSHLLALSARAMRQVLVDEARARKADKRGGGLQALTLTSAWAPASAAAVEVLALDELLGALHKDRPARRADRRAALLRRLYEEPPRSPGCWASATAPCAATGARRAPSCWRKSA
jgi:hypothetical protein